jgi:serralysin
MPENELQGPIDEIVGTADDDKIATGENADHLNGHADSDTLTSGDGDDLVAGDIVGRE